MNATTTHLDAFWAGTTYLHSQLPHLSDEGVMGYYYVQPTAIQTNNASVSTFSWEMLMLNTSADAMDALMEPINTHLSSARYGPDITFGSVAREYQSYYSWWSQEIHPRTVGIGLAIGSRLLDKESLTSNEMRLKQALQAAIPKGSMMLGHLLAGKGVKDARPAGGGNAVNPAWRKAYSHTGQLNISACFFSLVLGKVY
jgi:hypothetical protein